MKRRFWLDENPDGTCPACGFKIESCHIGPYCSNKTCPVSWVDGTALLTKEQVEEFSKKGFKVEPW